MCASYVKAKGKPAMFARWVEVQYFDGRTLDVQARKALRYNLYLIIFVLTIYISNYMLTVRKRTDKLSSRHTINEGDAKRFLKLLKRYSDIGMCYYAAEMDDDNR